MAGNEAMSGSRVTKPNPDPTALTTDALHREIAMLKELLEERRAGSKEVFALLQGHIDAIPRIVDEKINNLRLLHEEKFESIGTQFVERDTRTDQRAGDTKLAVDAAFAAAKETAGKSEFGFTKQIDAMADLIESKAENAESKISDIKDRLTAIESTKKGGDSTWVFVMAAAAAAWAVIATIELLSKHT
jgi:hypothetical protein